MVGSKASSESRRTTLRHARWLWLSLGVCVAVAAYALVGFVLVPKAVRFAATKFVRDNYGRTLSMSEVRANPFRLTLEIDQLAFPDHDAKPMIALGRLALDFEAWASLWQRAYVFKHVVITRPELHAVARKDGSFNLEDLVLPPDPDAAEDDELPVFSVQSLELSQGSMHYLDLARRKPFAQSVSPLSFVLKNFRSNPKGGDFKLTAEGEQGAHFAWRGKLALHPRIESAGTLEIRGLKVKSIAAYLGDALPFAMPDGSVEVDASYRMRLADKPQAEVLLSRIAVLDTSLRTRSEQETVVRIPKVSVSGAKLILEEKRLDIPDVLLEGITVNARLEPDKTLNLERLFKTKEELGAAPKTLEPIKRAVAKPDWDVRIARARLSQATVQFADQAIAPGEKVALNDMRAELRDLSLDQTQPVPVSFETQVNQDAGTIKAEGTLILSPLSVKLETSISDLELALAQAYVEPHAALIIREGTLDVKGTLSVEPGLGFIGELSLKNLATIDKAQRQDLLRVRQLDAHKVVFQDDKPSLSIERIVVDRAFAKLVLSAEQTFNLSEVLAPQDAEKGAAAKAKPSKQPSKDSVQSQLTDDSPRGPVIQIGSVSFKNTRLNFSDFYVQPNFAADIRGLAGAIKGISSDPRSRASMKLKGLLGDNSPVVIAGKLQPFGIEKFTDVSAECDNIALPVFNPYSGRFAGYNITRGELSTQIHYKIRNEKLEASHHVRISQLTWGEKTDSKEAAPLPVKLATVLLRDRDGIISLDVPVKGTLDDPSFRLGPIIRQVLKNIIVKAATAPFDLLGSLFKGAEKARYVKFQPGTAELDQDAKEGLAALGKAMREKPELKLDVPVGTLDQLDVEGLRAVKFQKSLERSVAATLSRREKKNGVPDYAELDPEQKLDALEKLHKDLTGKEPRLPDAPKPPAGTARKNVKSIAQQYQAEKLAQEVQSKVPVEPAELQALGRRRAEAIEAELLRASQIDTARVFLSNKGKVSREGEAVQFELSLK